MTPSIHRALGSLDGPAVAATPEVPGVVELGPGARRVKQTVAGAVVLLPLVGTAAAVTLASQRGVAALDLLLLAVMYCASLLGITVGFHRYFTHKAFKTSQPMRILFGVLGSMAAQGPLLFWVATHRCHHTHSDLPGDPHSPHLHGGGWRGMLHGLWHAHAGWMFTGHMADWGRFSLDLLRDPLAFRLHRSYPIWILLGLALPGAAGGAITGSWNGFVLGLLWGGLVRMFLVNQALWCVGSICHYFGRRPFRTDDHSANNWWIALFTFGEGLQNNHHAFPSAAVHKLRWWEPDVSAWVIGALRRLGLIWAVKAPSPARIENRRVEPNAHGGDRDGSQREE